METQYHTITVHRVPFLYALVVNEITERLTANGHKYTLLFTSGCLHAGSWLVTHRLKTVYINPTSFSLYCYRSFIDVYVLTNQYFKQQPFICILECNVHFLITFIVYFTCAVTAWMSWSCLFVYVFLHITEWYDMVIETKIAQAKYENIHGTESIKMQ